MSFKSTKDIENYNNCTNLLTTKQANYLNQLGNTVPPMNCYSNTISCKYIHT